MAKVKDKDILKHYNVTIRKVSTVTFEDVFAYSEAGAEENAEESCWGGHGQYCFDDYELELKAYEQTRKPEEVKQAWIELFGDIDADEMFERG